MEKKKLILILILIGALIFQKIETRETFTYLEFPNSQGIFQYVETTITPKMLAKITGPLTLNNPINPSLYYKYSEKTKNITNLNLEILNDEELNKTLAPLYGAKIELNHRFAKIFPAKNKILPENHLKRNILAQMGIFEKKRGIFVSTEYTNISFLFLPIGLANLREYTISDKGYESNSYRQYCKSLDKINETKFYENLIETAISGINKKSFDNLTYNEMIVLMDAIGIAMVEHHRVLITYGKEKNETVNAGGVITKALFGLYFNNGGKVLSLSKNIYELKSSNCMWQETFIFINPETKLNEELITKYILVNHNQLHKNWIKELRGDGKNLLKDIRDYLQNPINYDDKKQKIINEFIKILKTESTQITKFLKTEMKQF